MTVYQCPDCLGVHGETTEALVGLFMRCDACLLEAEIIAEEQLELEFAPAQAA